MKEKILAALKERNKQYGLSDETLSAMVEACGITEESAIEDWVKSQEPVLAVMQKFVDKRVSDAIKNKPIIPKPEDGDLAKQLGEMRQSLLDELKAQMKPDESLQKEYAALKERLDAAEAKEKKAAFLAKLKRVGKESGISEAIVDLSLGSFSDDMDDKAIGEKFADIKKTLIAQGVPEAGFHQLQTSEEAARKSANDWVDAQIKAAKEAGE